MISGSELRKGVVVDIDGKLFQIIEYQHIKMKRTALAKVKMRDVNGGHIIERSFQSDDKLVRARLESTKMQYLYNESGLYYFMDQETFEQTPLSEELLGDALHFLKDNMVVEATSYKEEIIGIEMPLPADIQVVESDRGFKGDTATGGTNPVKLETGITINVPLFINEGDTIKVDTRSANYLERVNS